MNEVIFKIAALYLTTKEYAILMVEKYQCPVSILAWCYAISKHDGSLPMDEELKKECWARAKQDKRILKAMKRVELAKAYYFIHYVFQ